MAKKLTIKEGLFVDYYFKYKFNASKAALEAGYSPKTACHIGYENLKKSHIQEAIQFRFKKLAKEKSGEGFNEEHIVRELKRIGTSDITKTISRDGFLLTGAELKKLKPGVRAAISSIESTAGGGLRVRFYDKTPALALAAKILGLVIDRSKVQTVETHEDLLEDLAREEEGK